jgi:hypothetical protein
MATAPHPLHGQKAQQEKVHEWDHQPLHKRPHFLAWQATNQTRTAPVEERCQAYQAVWRQPDIGINKDQNGV